MKSFLTLFTLLLLSQNLLAGNALNSINASANIAKHLGIHVEYLIDPTNRMGIQQALSSEQAAWQQSEKDVPNFGYGNTSYWFRINIKNVDESVQDYLLAIDYPLLDHIEFYRIANNQVLEQTITGDIYPFEQRAVQNRNFLFPIQLPNQASNDIYIRIKTQGSAQLPISLYDSVRYNLEDQEEQLLKAMYYGMIIVFVLYNFFLFLSIKERSYFYYVNYFLFLLLLTSGLHGFLYQYIFPDSPKIQQLSILVAVPTAMLFACLFTTSFLRLGRWAPTLNKLLNFFMIACGLSIVGAFFLPYVISTTISVFLTIPCSILILFSGPYAWRQGQKSARYFTLAWIFIVIGILVGASSKFGLIPRNLFTEYAINWATAFEALFLSFALADRFNREKNARIKAQNERLIEAEQRKEAENKLYHQATHQNINGFPNMVILQSTLQELMDNKSVENQEFSLCFLNLSRMHEINKTLGHGNADLILSLYSERLTELAFTENESVPIEKNDTETFYFSHVGGVLFAHIFKPDRDKAVFDLAADLRRKIAEPIEFNGMRLDLGVAIGVATYPIHGTDAATLIRHARVAVDVAAKSSPHIIHYAKEHNPYSSRRLALMGELKKAIDEDSLELYFQPIIDCNTNETIGAEALLRWNHPHMGFIPPDEFISMSEKTGLIDLLTPWVMNKAFYTLKQWNDADIDLMMSINISPVNLQDTDFVESALALTKKYDIPADSVVLEVTETAVMKDPENALKVLNELASHGFKIGMDDFGTGHSSLSYIRSLPVYEVKIDRSFVMNMETNTNDAIITQTALNLSHDLGYKVVAEGVENAGIQQKLKDMGCDFTQGYYIARPMPVSDFLAWFNQQQENSLNQDNIRSASDYS